MSTVFTWDYRWIDEFILSPRGRATHYIAADEFISTDLERRWFWSYGNNNTRPRTALLRDRFLSTITAVGISAQNARLVSEQVAGSWAWLADAHAKDP